MNPDLFWIPGPWRGKLAVATRPRGGDWLEDEASGWRQAGLNLIVSLLESEEAAHLDLVQEADVAKSKGINFISFPIPDRGVPASMRAALSLLRKIAEALDEGKNVAVHCRQGIGRSGSIAAGVLVTSGIGSRRRSRLLAPRADKQFPKPLCSFNGSVVCRLNV
jgi:rhodanese-related sulfurtransferase